MCKEQSVQILNRKCTCPKKIPQWNKKHSVPSMCPLLSKKNSNNASDRCENCSHPILHLAVMIKVMNLNVQLTIE